MSLCAEREEEKKAKIAAKAKAKEEKKMRKLAKQKQADIESVDQKSDDDSTLEIERLKVRTISPAPSRKSTRGSEQIRHSSKPVVLGDVEITPRGEELVEQLAPILEAMQPTRSRSFQQKVDDPVISTIHQPGASTDRYTVETNKSKKKSSKKKKDRQR